MGRRERWRSERWNLYLYRLNSGRCLMYGQGGKGQERPKDVWGSARLLALGDCVSNWLHLKLRVIECLEGNTTATQLRGYQGYVGTAPRVAE